MYGPSLFKHFLEECNRNFVDEIQIVIIMKKLNLLVDVNQRQYPQLKGAFRNTYDYDSILTKYY